jgi:hypothetical protein
VQQSFRDALRNVSRLKLLSIRRRWQMEIRPGSIRNGKTRLGVF